LPAEKRKVEGTIVDRDTDRMTLRLAATDTDLVVKLSGFTEVQEKKSNPFRRGRKYMASQLVPGLNVIVEGRGDSDGALMADKIRFTDDQFKAARTVDVRMAPVEQNARRMSGQLSELESVSNAARGGARAAQDTADKAHDRITSLDDYEAVQSITVRFKVGSAQLSDEAKKSLDEVAQQAKSRKGYVIEVAGFASSEGNLAYNRSLSRQRAQAVSEYLAEEHDVPLRRIMIPSGYGISHPVADNASRAGRQENRRAEVRILVSRGIAPAASQPSSTSQERASSRPEDDR
jgi:outer membrane protein OmpA-like peptidoglycan-associated protein